MALAANPDDLERRRVNDAPAVNPSRGDEPLRQAQADLARALAENEHLKAQFLQAQKMEAIGRLASGVAHDFKNVLTLVAGYAEMLLKQADTVATREPLLEIRSACQRAVGLAEQLLSYSRKEAAQQSPLSLNAILADAGRMLERMLPAHVDLAIREDPGLGLVLANAGQMHQVLLNLVVNARDAMPTGGRLAIEVRNADIEAGSPEAVAGARPGPHVVLSVADTGVGMDEETRRRALEPFFTTKEGRVGTGLGLSTVHSIVTDCRGRVVIESTRGAGTKVLVYLPRLETANGDMRDVAAPAPGREATPPARRLLVVDDDEDVRRLLVDVLSGAGYDVSVAAGLPESGSPAAGDRPYDLAVVDLVTLERAGGSPPPGARPSKIIGLSGTARQPGTLTSGFEIGATVAKPILPRQLLRAVRDMLEAD
jgi:two-component system, cell cycle sensor histidine kinase and response regulator CckA